MTSDQSDGNNKRILSKDELQQRVKEYYTPIKSKEGQWFRCQRSIDSTTCDRLVFFPTGVRAHENHHSIKSGNGPLIELDRFKSSQSEESKTNVSEPDVEEQEALDDIISEFDELDES